MGGHQLPGQEPGRDRGRDRGVRGRRGGRGALRDGRSPGTGHRPDAAAVFDLDSIELVELASASTSTSVALPARPLCSVAHAPAAPPAARRLARLLAKIDAGADVGIRGPLRRRWPARGGGRRAPRAGFAGLVLGCVPVVTARAAPKSSSPSPRTAAARIPGRDLNAEDPAESGGRRPPTSRWRYSRCSGVDGVNLSARQPAGRNRSSRRDGRGAAAGYSARGPQADRGPTAAAEPRGDTCSELA